MQIWRIGKKKLPEKDNDLKCKAGYAGEDSPSALIPTMMPEITDCNLKDQLSIKYVMEHGIIHKDDMELLWQFI